MDTGQEEPKHNIKKYYKNRNTNLKKSNQLLAHNQFITQAINLRRTRSYHLGFCSGLQLFEKWKKKCSYFFVPYLILMFFAFMSDDMLEVQAGVTIFSFFGTLYVVLQFKKLIDSAKKLTSFFTANPR